MSALRSLAAAVVACALFAPASGRAQTAPDATLLLEQADQILELIQLQRGVPATEPVARAVLSRDELLERILGIVERELPPDAREVQNRVAVALGLVAPGGDWFGQYMTLLEAEIAGFYDDHNGTFYILDDMAGPLQAPIMAHELFHAIQDQRWGIRDVVGESEWLTDGSLAVQALLEGDALAVMTAYMLDDPDQVTRDSLTRSAMTMSMSGAAVRNTSDAPDAMWAQLVFPYTAGLRFVFEVVEPSDWGPVDALYVDPPVSTEQVLHPERYLDRDEPTWLSFAADAPRSAERYVADVFGEFMISETCSQLLPDVSTAACERAADGWDGDRLEAYRFADDDARDLIVWASVWDDADEARAFAAVASRLSGPWLDASAVSVGTGAHGGAWIADTEAGTLWVEHWGDLALLVLDWRGEVRQGARRRDVENVVDSVWTSLSRSRYPALRGAN